MDWLPDDWDHPPHVELPTGHQDRKDLQHHADETELIGCCYVDPWAEWIALPREGGTD